MTMHCQLDSQVLCHYLNGTFGLGLCKSRSLIMSNCNHTFCRRYNLCCNVIPIDTSIFVISNQSVVEFEIYMQ